jgi:hypothetical protein
MQMIPERTVKLDLPVSVLQVILLALGKQPVEVAFHAVTLIHEQVKEQAVP